MKSIHSLLGRAAVPPKLRLLPIVALLGFFTASAPVSHARENKVELPLILDSERAELRAQHMGGSSVSERINYTLVVLHEALAPSNPGDCEPVGLHIDPTWSIGPTKPKLHGFDGGDSRARGPGDQVPVHYMAQALAFNTNKYMLMSARVEKRLVHEYRVRGSASESAVKFEELFEKEGIEPRLVAHDFYVLLEAPGKERPFPYESRPRATQYEIDREAWLVRNENYTAQGLIYQPTKSTPDAYPERDIRMRHAAAALAKLTGKEVFVQPLVEKREFKAPKNAGTLETPELELEALIQQLEKASVAIVELNPLSLGLVAH